MEEKQVVKEELTTPEPMQEGEKKQEAVESTPSAEPAPGSKTESELLLKSLNKEREKRKLLEERLRLMEEKLENVPLSEGEGEGDISEEGKALKKELTSLKADFSKVLEEKEYDKVIATYPILKDKLEEFKEYKDTRYPNIELPIVAKVYLTENGFFEPLRKGLEKPTGGDKSAVKDGMTAEEVKDLRENNFKRYQRLLSENKIKIV
jgi:hypothetical protein